MKVYLMEEYDLPKGKERYEDYINFIRERMFPLNDKLNKSGLYKRMSFSDNTGHIVRVLEFEDTDSFSTFWNNKELHKTKSGFAKG